jgi:hypothetical protein
MKVIFFGTGILVLGLGTLIWTSPVSAQRGGHASAGHAAAHVGSVHFASRPPVRSAPVHAAPIRSAPVHAAPVRTAPGVRSGAVRSEHFAGSAPRGAYRNPYRDEYFRHFRPGFLSFLIGDALYYYYESLPVGYQIVVIGGITYYVLDGVYYQPYIYGGQTVYMVVPTQ